MHAHTHTCKYRSLTLRDHWQDFTKVFRYNDKVHTENIGIVARISANGARKYPRRYRSSLFVLSDFLSLYVVCITTVPRQREAYESEKESKSEVSPAPLILLAFFQYKTLRPPPFLALFSLFICCLYYSFAVSHDHCFFVFTFFIRMPSVCLIFSRDSCRTNNNDFDGFHYKSKQEQNEYIIFLHSIWCVRICLYVGMNPWAIITSENQFHTPV